MKIKFIIHTLTVFALIACNKIQDKDITIIDNIKLGVKKDSLDMQFLKKYMLLQGNYTKVFFDNYDEIENNKIYSRLSKAFDFQEYISSNIHHYGFYLPTVDDANNVIGIDVLLGHTSHATLIDKNYGLIDITNETQLNAFDQNVREDLINKIESLLKEKYGTPKKTIKGKGIKNYVIQGKNVNTFETGNNMLGESIVWETEYLNITYFKGIPSKYVFYDKNINSYIYNFSPQEISKISNDEIVCNSYAYISYYLKEKAIKELKLEKINL